MRALRSSCILLAATLSQAQAPQTPPEPASITGTVTQSITGAPLVRAHVALRGSGQNPKIYGALTTADGTFSITGIVAGAYQAMVDQVGFFMPAGPDGRASMEIILRPADKKEAVKLRLAPLGSIAGRVVDSEGDPMENALIQVDTGQSQNSPSRDLTDDKGRFKLVGLQPGRYRVKAAVSGASLLPTRPEIRTDGTAEVRHFATYYGGATDYQSATRVDVKTGAEVNGLEIRMVRAPMVRISGRVVGAVPGETRGVGLMWNQRNSSRSGGAMKKDGTFEAWNIDPGTYSLSAMWMNGGDRIQTVPLTVEVGFSNIDNLELRVLPPADVAGQVVYEDDQARPNSRPNQRPMRGGNAPQPAARIDLRTADPVFSPDQPRGDIAEDGSFRLSSVRPARYVVALSWPWAYVKSITAGSNQVDGNVLDLRAGVEAAITVHVSSEFASVTGMVSEGGDPAPAARVALVRDDYQSLNDVALATADATGSYSFNNVRPGKYRIAAIDANEGSIYSGNLDDYEDVLAHIEVQPKDKLTKDLKRHPAVK